MRHVALRTCEPTVLRVAALVASCVLVACSGSDDEVVLQPGAGGVTGSDGETSSGGQTSPSGGGSNDSDSGDPGGPDDPGNSALPPPPNDLDAGDGTLGPNGGGTVVYNGRTADTPYSQTGCRLGAFPNQYIVHLSSFGGDFGLKFAVVSVWLPLDQLTTSRVFEVGRAPEEQDYTDVDHAVVLVTGTGTGDDDAERGIGGEVWIRIVDGVIEMRLEALPLGDYETYNPNGNTVSAALLCDEPVPDEWCAPTQCD